MKVLVTGGAGYIGGHTSDLLHKQGHEVVIYDNLSTGFREAVLHGGLVVDDLSNTKTLDSLLKQHRFDAVVHFAAALSVKESVANPALYYRNNVSNTLNLIEQCCEHGVAHFIFSSSAAVYGEVKSKEPITETTPTCPINPYGWSKLMSEQMLGDIAPLCGMKYTNLRYYNVAGADSTARLGGRRGEHLIRMICRTAAGLLENMEIYGTDYPTHDGTCVRDYIHVTDLADIHIKALDYLVAGGDSITLNCGYGTGFSVREIIDVAKKVTGVDFPVLEKGRRPMDPAQLVASVDKLTQVLAWQPAFNDIETIIKTAWEWEKELLQQTQGD